MSGPPASGAAASLQGAARLLQLERQLRMADKPGDLAFRLVNDVRLIVANDVAVAWRDGAGKGQVMAVSNQPEPARDAPMLVWLARLFSQLAGEWRKSASAPQPRPMTIADVGPDLAGDWRDFLPATVLLVPLVTPTGRVEGALLLGRARPFSEEESRVLARLGETAAHALEALQNRSRQWWAPARWQRRRLLWGAIVLVLLAGFLPVRLTVLAAAEVTPLNPEVVRAPVDGVIERVAAVPNEPVAAGDLLVRLDPADLSARLSVAERSLEIARAEFRQAQQTALRDAEASSRLAVLAARVAQAEAEAGYLAEQLGRIEIRASRPGIAIVPDPENLDGRPVRIGERIMSVADPAAARITAWLAVEDAIPLSEGARATLFLNILADRPARAVITSIDYRPTQSPAGILGYRVLAAFDDPEAGVPRIGARGTLTLRGEQVPLFIFLFRRPLAALRPWLAG